MPHRDAAYNLARWILRGRTQAEDVTQEAFLRAYRSFGGFQTGNARAWLLQIVRNCCFTWLQQNHVAEEMTEFDEQTMPPKAENPESLPWPPTTANACNAPSRICPRISAKSSCFGSWKAALTKKSPPSPRAHRHRDVCARSRQAAAENFIDRACSEGGHP